MNKVICINNQDFPASLSFGKVYEIQFDDDEIPVGYIRIKDDSGGIYIYPMKYFREHKETE